MEQTMTSPEHEGVVPEVDAVVVGAGFSGLYALQRLRTLGFSVVVFDEAADVGGTWYWNRYPGARCDIPTTDYTFSFDPDLEDAWTWSEKYATQPEILAYLGFVADRYDLRRDIRFSTRVVAATWDEEANRWRLSTDGGDEIRCRFYIMATGCLSLPKTPDIEGAERFRGETYFTSKWPHQEVDFTSKRVAVIGTGSSGIQAIPLIAAQASSLTVFQRTPNFSVPAHNGPPSAERLAALKADRAAYRHQARWSRGGIPTEITDVSGVTATEEVRRQRFEWAWNEGELFAILGVFNDQFFNPVANEHVAEMIRERIRSVVEDPDVADALCPKDYPFGTKRPCLDTGYYQTFNLPHVRLVDLRKTPISSITEKGVDTTDESFEFDAIVFATGFDAMTGPLVNVDITGRKGVTLKDKWATGPSTYLGLTTTGFPNFFMITGPGSPSVLSNMAVSIEQHVDWVADCLTYMRAQGFDTVEPTDTAEAGWNQHVADCAAVTLHPLANSWYMGANVPGKPRMFLPYIGGVDGYRGACDEVVAKDYLGFALTGSGGSQCHDGVVRRLQPDVALVLQMYEQLGMPAFESMPVEQGRMVMAASAAVAPPGPEVGEVFDGTLPGAAGDLDYRLYRPTTSGPHPVLVYFHGGGWVLGNVGTDDRLCRDLCARTDAVVVSVDYRHAPESRFPAPVEDAWAAVRWIAARSEELGGIPGRLGVAGWSAGANLAAVVCQLARDAGGPAIAGQLLVNPVTDCDTSRASYDEHAQGYIFNAPTMRWFWDLYADPADRTDPRAAPLRGELSGLPPAIVVTSEFDPLRDEGTAYAEALSAAGVPVVHVKGRGQIHTSVPMVGVIISAGPIRAQMAEHMARWLSAPAKTAPGPHRRPADSASR
jgi:cation diffusion facilitator CzcD-associated flavoprotein CzcO/acetyl esterase/lipase